MKWWLFRNTKQKAQDALFLSLSEEMATATDPLDVESILARSQLLRIEKRIAKTHVHELALIAEQRRAAK